MRRGVHLSQEELRPYLLELPGLPVNRSGASAPNVSRCPAQDSACNDSVSQSSQTSEHSPFVSSTWANQPERTPQPLVWSEVFGNAQPVEIEVGTGKGLFLVNTAPLHPETNYLGIEIVRKYQLFSANRIAKRACRNVRLCCADAREVFRDRVLSASVQAVHVYFPDPWWKKRHHKRRVFTEDFAQQVTRILIPGGYLRLATDVADYADMVREVVTKHTPLISLPIPELSGTDQDYATNFERKARLQGRKVHQLSYCKEVSDGQ